MNLQKKLNILLSGPELKRVILLFIGMLCMAGLEVLGVASVVPFMAVVTTPELIHENSYLSLAYVFFAVDSDQAFIIALGAVVIVTLLISNGFQVFMAWKITYFTTSQTHRLSIRLLKKYLAQPYTFFLNQNTTELSKNIIDDVVRGVKGVLLPVLQVLAKFIVFITIISMLVLLDPNIAITVSVVLGGAYWVILIFARRRLFRIGLASTKTSSQMYRFLSEAMCGIKDVKLRGSEQVLVKRYSMPSETQANYAAQHALIAQLPRYILEVVAFGGIIGIVIVMVTVDGGTVEIIPKLSLYAMAGYRLMPALQQIYSGLTSIKFNSAALDILIDGLSQPTSEAMGGVQHQKLPFNKELRLSELMFFYPNTESRVLNKLSLTITCKSTVGIVGGTGCGKTTLIDILLGLLSHGSGYISVDGVSINSNNVKGWQKNLGYVPQSIYLIDDTIEHNIAFGVPENEVVVDQVKKAAVLANIDDFVSELPDQYRTVVGERGVRLSGGQRQRIGIARALYHNPEVLILDEATSSLDGITENLIMNAIYGLSHEKTIIIIAHRLSTVKKCDVIHVIDGGRVTDSGSYDELMNRNDLFRGMSELSRRGE